jgi:hypothetical protein
VPSRFALHCKWPKPEHQCQLGIYASVLQALGLRDGLSQVADISKDSVGQSLASAFEHGDLKRALAL